MRAPPVRVSRSTSETSPSTSTPWRRAASCRSSFTRARRWSPLANSRAASHDFNNLLMVVSGNLELIEEAADNGRVRQFATAARLAADRGAKLTAQLLAFSRRQRLSPKLVNANELIAEFQELIRQAVGGACEVELLTDRPLWLCHVDPPLLETTL